jgi:cation transporter-like permease
MMNLKRRIKELDNVEITYLSSMVLLLSIIIVFTLIGYYMQHIFAYSISIVTMAAFVVAYLIAMMAAFVFIITVMDYKDYKMMIKRGKKSHQL